MECFICFPAENEQLLSKYSTENIASEVNHTEWIPVFSFENVRRTLLPIKEQCTAFILLLLGNHYINGLGVEANDVQNARFSLHSYRRLVLSTFSQCIKAQLPFEWIENAHSAALATCTSDNMMTCACVVVVSQFLGECFYPYFDVLCFKGQGECIGKGVKYNWGIGV